GEAGERAGRNLRTRRHALPGRMKRACLARGMNRAGLARGMNRAGVAALVLLLAAPAARALEPASVSVTGVVSASEVGEAAPRDAAYRAGLVAAVLEAAKGLLPPDKFAAESERLRATVKPLAQRFVLTYRIDGKLEKRRSPLDPAVEEYALPLTARVDTNQLRAFLVPEGFPHQARAPPPPPPPL